MESLLPHQWTRPTVLRCCLWFDKWHPFAWKQGEQRVKLRLSLSQGRYFLLLLGRYVTNTALWNHVRHLDEITFRTWWKSHISKNYKFLTYFLYVYIFLIVTWGCAHWFLESVERARGEKEKHPCERETLTSCLPCTPHPGIHLHPFRVQDDTLTNSATWPRALLIFPAVPKLGSRSHLFSSPGHCSQGQSTCSPVKTHTSL